MKKASFVFAAVCAFAVLPFMAELGPFESSVAFVWLGVLLAVGASGSFQSLAFIGGALGAFGAGVLVSSSPALAGAVWIGAAFAERTTRVRGASARAAHVVAAVLGGALAGGLSHAYASASVPLFAVAVVVSAVLSALPLLIDADDPVAHALDQYALLVSEPAKGALVAGAELRRGAQEVALDRTTANRVTTTWQSLLRLAEARVNLERTRPRSFVALAGKLEGSHAATELAGPPSSARTTGDPSSTAKTNEPPSTSPSDEPPSTSSDESSAIVSSPSGSSPPSSTGGEPKLSPPSSAMSEVRGSSGSAADAVRTMVDQRIAEHVGALARTYTAVDAARAANVGLDDTALKHVESMGDSFEEVSRALVEVREVHSVEHRTKES